MTVEARAPAPAARRVASLRAQLQLGFGGIALAVALLSAAAVFSLDRLGDTITAILRENYDSVVACEDMKEALERQDSAALLAATGRDDIAVATLADNRARFDEAFGREARNITLPGEGERVREIAALNAAYRSDVDRVLGLDRAAQHDAYFRELLPRFTALKGRVDEVLRLNHEHMEASEGAAKQTARATVRTAIGVSLAAVFLALALAYRLPRALSRPLEALTRSARAIGGGDLDVRVDEPAIAELTPLALAFNRMAERLRAYRESSLGELLAAKDLARATLECMLDPVVVLDRDGGVRLANEAAVAAFGLRIGGREELSAGDVVLPEALTRARDLCLQTGEPVLPRSLSEAVRFEAAGRETYYLVRAISLRTAPGDAPSAIVVAQDVTRFRRIDDLKSDMVATVSHEFKTPLTSLRMATHLLLDSNTGGLSEVQRDLVVTARDDTERLRAMVEELLDVVRIESEAGALHRMPVDPFGLLCEVVDAHRAIARDKGVALDVEPSARTGFVSVDPERLSIAVANLVANAVRHTPSGGSVRLRAAKALGALRIEVTDSGEGIAPELIPHLFERAGHGADEAKAGDTSRHGLGLGIAREIIRLHGGELEVTSTPGQGSTFTLVLDQA